jgi:hypothetical protein
VYRPKWITVPVNNRKPSITAARKKQKVQKQNHDPNLDRPGPALEKT